MNREIRYVAVGDSYTIGEGVAPEQSWPALLTRHLTATGVNIHLIDNLSATGRTTQDVIDLALPAYQAAKPLFASLLIGVNDWVQGVDRGTFQRRFEFLLDRMTTALPQSDRLIVVTIPDFSVTPAGAQYGHGRDVSAGIAEFNAIVIAQAKQRRLRVVDIFPTTQQMENDRGLIAPDGLHPSGKEYALWEALIYPVARGMLGGDETVR